MPRKQPDYVLVFDLSTEGKDVKKAEAKEEEYDRLLGVLNDAGFDVTARPGEPSTHSLLIFVKLKDERLAVECHRDRLADWLNDIPSVPASPRHARDFDKAPLAPSERLRLVYSILASPRSSKNVSVTSSASAGTTAGLASLPSKEFPSVKDVFPPHDAEYNSNWLAKWRKSSLVIPDDDLDSIKDVYGERIALYFAFLRAYFRSLYAQAALGFIFWLAKMQFTPFYSCTLVLYAVVFVEAWRIKERQLSVKWGSYNSHKTERTRPTYRGLRQEVDPVTGVEHGVFPWYRVLVRQLTTVPLLLAAAAVLFALISAIYCVETLISETYDGPGKRFVTLVPTVLFVGLVPRFTALWSTIAESLTDWENHEHQSDHDRSLARKIYALNFLVAYGSPLLTAFVYTPFGSVLIPTIVDLLPSKRGGAVTKHFNKKNASAHHINATKLHTQIVAYTLTNQITGAITEIGVPLLMEYANDRVKQMKGNVQKVDDAPEEKEYLTRIRHEASLPEYNVFPDYAEMAVQFGYITLFSAVWPIAPVWSLVNNFFELRGDAFKLTKQSKRPVPSRDTTIGPWLEILTVVAYIAALINAALVYLYRPRLMPPLEPTMFGRASAEPPFRNETLPSTSLVAHVSSIAKPGAVEPILHALFMALLVALVAEHVFVFTRASVRFILEHASWNDCEADRKLRSHQLELKKAYLEEIELRHGPVELAKLSGRLDKIDRERSETSDPKTNDEDEKDTFWTRNDGKQYIKSQYKSD